MRNQQPSFRRRLAAIASLAVTVAAVLIGHGVLRAQSLSYTSGQNVVPAYEGWEEDTDGSKYFLFGYMNRNWEEELNVPIGPDNTFDIGGAELGQPTHFLPRRNRFVFRVKVPQGFTEKSELMWTLTAYGKTEKAYASLRLDYKVDDVVKASETGALGAGTSSPTVRSNEPPTVKLEGPTTRTAKVGQPLTLVTMLTDDGIPKALTQAELTAALLARARAASGVGPGEGRATTQAPSSPQASTSAAPSPAPAAAGRGVNPALLPPARVTVGKNLGLHQSWFVYRGAGKVTFTPPQIKAWEDTRAGANSPWAPVWFAPPIAPDNKVTADVVFSEPGTYVLRVVADDGALTSGQNVTVTVTP
jgi:hypothetical protein